MLPLLLLFALSSLATPVAFEEPYKFEDTKNFQREMELKEVLSTNAEGSPAYVAAIQELSTMTGSAQRSVESRQAPANDLCSAATPVTVGVTPFSTTGATTNTNAFFACGSRLEVWFSFVAPTTDRYYFTTCGAQGGSATFDTVIGLYSNTCVLTNNIPNLGCNDDTCGLQSYESACLTAGVTYRISVGSNRFPVPTTGSGNLAIGVVPVCRGPQDLTAPCGPAFSDWRSNFGFWQSLPGPQCGTPSATGNSTFCGKQPVRTGFTFNTSALQSTTATFQTADGSCTCDYCYTFENFDQSSVVPPCFVPLFGGSRWRINSTAGYYDSAPNSLGVTTNGLPPGFYEIATGLHTFRKPLVTFWLRLSLAPNQVFNLWYRLAPFVFFNFVPRSAISGTCIPNNSFFPNIVSFVNTTQTCSITVDLRLLPFACFPGSTSITAAFGFDVVILPPLRRVVAPAPVVPVVPQTGVWVDSIRSCGSTFRCSAP